MVNKRDGFCDCETRLFLQFLQELLFLLFALPVDQVGATEEYNAP